MTVRAKKDFSEGSTGMTLGERRNAKVVKKNSTTTRKASAKSFIFAADRQQWCLTRFFTTINLRFNTRWRGWLLSGYPLEARQIAPLVRAGLARIDGTAAPKNGVHYLREGLQPAEYPNLMIDVNLISRRPRVTWPCDCFASASSHWKKKFWSLDRPFASYAEVARFKGVWKFRQEIEIFKLKLSFNSIF